MDGEVYFGILSSSWDIDRLIINQLRAFLLDAFVLKY